MKLLCAIFVIWISSCCQAQFFQYFYSNPAVPSYFSPFPSPVFSNFFSQVPTQQTFDYRQPKEFEINVPEENDSESVEVPSNQPQPSFSPASDNYRGFGYHTNYEDGARATVVFFRGGPIGNSILETPRERFTVASDPQQPLDIQQRVRKIFDEQQSAVESRSSKQLPFPNLSRIVEALQEEKTPNGLVHFYSNPGGYPADTAPLPTARALNISSTLNETSNNNTTSESDTAESIQSRTVLKVNSLIESAAESTTAATTAAPTTSSTERPVATTTAATATSSTERPVATTTAATATSSTERPVATSAADLETTTVDDTIAIFLNTTVEESEQDVDISIRLRDEKTEDATEKEEATTETVEATTSL